MTLRFLLPPAGVLAAKVRDFGSNLLNSKLRTFADLGTKRAKSMVAMGSPRFTRSLVSTIHAVSLCRRLGLLSCLSTWPPELADMAGTRPRVVTMSLNTVPPVDCKCAAAAAGPSSRLALSDRFVRVLSQPLVEQPETAERELSALFV